MEVLQLTVHFPPNVGGVETHLWDLVTGLIRKKHEVFVLTYRPLSVKAPWKIFEREKSLSILRLPWIPGFFYKFVHNPLVEFMYLLPGLFLATPFVITKVNPDVIQSHGLVAGFIAVFWGKIFGKRVLTTTHSIYSFPKKGLYRNFVKRIFDNSQAVLTLSKQSKKEIVGLGIDEKKVKVFTYWIDLNKFKKVGDAKKKLKWQKKFVVLFVGRLIPEKGVYVLLEAARSWSKKITLAVAGTGPLEDEVRDAAKENWNIMYLGKIEQENLPLYYSASDLTIVPSTSEEGFGRVILESLACGTPVIGANRGAISEAMDETVGQLIEITPAKIKSEVEYFYKNPKKREDLAKRTRSFALERYSSKNIEQITQTYG
jgi:glycosyltransferase involved in cell wall biosynthesis